MAQAIFDKCDLIDLTVTTPKKASAGGLADFYKRLRVAFQSQGNRGEASRFYFQERCQQLRGRAIPLIPRVPGVPGLAYSGSLVSLYEMWAREQMTARRALTLIAKNALCVVKIATNPMALVRVMREKTKLVADAIDWLVWGFGERPSRVFWWMALLVCGFALKYFVGPNQHLRGDWAASLSCSLYNVATIGCDYRGRFDSIEGIAGVILLAIMVAGLSNRTRY